MPSLHPRRFVVWRCASPLASYGRCVIMCRLVFDLVGNQVLEKENLYET